MATRWAVTAAVQESDLPPPARLVVFVLADIADNDTAAVPSTRTLSLTELGRKSGLGRSTVARMLILLESSGWVKRDQPEDSARARAGEKTRYQLKIGGSPRAGLVPERDYLASPRAGLEVVPERDWGSPTAGRKRKNPSTNPQEPSKSCGAHTRPQRGTRIPKDFSATPAMIEWARKNTPLVGAAETANFVDYWTAESGTRASKIDWTAAWRKWMRKSQTDAVNRRNRPGGRSSGANLFRNDFTGRRDDNPFATGAAS